ncbi:MAG TPA: cupin domain-containing protein [Saprospiraceae bacterium]|nr:cupin domain-containing protein [Saprospiraceae bacterium]HMQ82129.1 cupin domain-containing protein [Saprospiraceae bacterium]
MDTTLQQDIRSTSRMEWQPLKEAGVDTSGIFVKILRVDGSGRPPSFLLRFDPGAAYPYHNHPAGEELFVLEGSCILEGSVLEQGDYLYTPPGFKHSVKTETGCVLLFLVPEEVEIIS